MIPGARLHPKLDAKFGSVVHVDLGLESHSGRSYGIFLHGKEGQGGQATCDRAVPA